MTLRELLRGLDGWLIGAALGLCALSVVTLALTTPNLVPGSPLYLAKHQLIWVVVGLVVMALMMWVPHTLLRRFRWLIYGLTLGMLMVVLVHGQSVLGAQRWINIGPFQFQPSEFAKLGVIIILADLLERKRGAIRTLRDMAPAIAIALVPMLLVIKQPDLGTALVIAGILGVLLYEAGGSGWKILALFGGTAGFVVLLVWLHVQAGFPLPLHQYQVTRLLAFVNPNADPLGTGYNLIQSEIAIASGHLTGVGVAEISSLISFLPAADTDFAFASLGLVGGLLAMVAALGLYAVVVGRTLVIAHQESDGYSSLIVLGAAALLTIHVFMNVGMATGIMPVVGVPAPFISYGGSSVVTDFAALGLILSSRLHRVHLSFH
ncbi:MAG: FtsW/RodA/SpoVE family cell cycle protein [Sulfobacillus sp.]